jgi:TRAP-type C4-dicarboxylate transport system permease small subunit
MADTNPIRGIAEKLKNAQLKLAMLALGVMMMVTVLDVTLRYVFGTPIHGSYDIVEATLVVFVFHGLAACFFARQNIVIDLIDSVVSDRVATILIRISDVVTVLLLALIIWAMASPAHQAFEYGDRKLELGLQIWILWAIAIAGLVGTLFCAIGAMFQPVTRHHGGERL